MSQNIIPPKIIADALQASQSIQNPIASAIKDIQTQVNPRLQDDQEDDDDVKEPGTKQEPKKKKKNNIRQTLLILAKSFIASSVLFLPRAFMHGGILFSPLFIFFISAICVYSFLKLYSVFMVTRLTVGGMAEKLYGKWLKNIIQWCIVLSQCGFCCSYFSFMEQNLSLILENNTSARLTSLEWIVILFAVWIPFVMIRRMSKFAYTSLIADACIFGGLIYLFIFCGDRLSTRGSETSLTLVAGSTIGVCIGNVVFAFEGVSMVVPIAESMEKPEKFPVCLIGVLSVISVLYAAMGSLGYATFGDNIADIITLNIPDGAGQIVLVIIYCFAVFFTLPLMFYPTMQILEPLIWGLSNKSSTNNKKDKISVIINPNNNENEYDPITNTCTTANTTPAMTPFASPLVTPLPTPLSTPLPTPLSTPQPSPKSSPKSSPLPSPRGSPKLTTKGSPTFPPPLELDAAKDINVAIEELGTEYNEVGRFPNLSGRQKYWIENAFRVCILALIALISYVARSNLTNFVSIVGSGTGGPLCFIFPPLLHYRALAITTSQKVCDILLIIFGFGVLVFTLYESIISW